MTDDGGVWWEGMGDKPKERSANKHNIFIIPKTKLKLKA